MVNNSNSALISHLMRRAGFGATPNETVQLVKQGYEETVEKLLNYDNHDEIDERLLYRYLPMTEMMYAPEQLIVECGNLAKLNWLYRMVNTERPLEEKMTLFWHHVFATGLSKVQYGYEMNEQILLFREYALGNYRDLLIRLAANPAMIFWLDNQENHKRAPNENWGRELLELFSMGVGNYTENDVKEASRAFTGWTFSGKVSGIQLGPIPWRFEYHSEDHDWKEKEFLGQFGQFNGEDIVEIIVQQPACAKFLARHLYNFFVADEPPVTTWPIAPPPNPAAVDLIAHSIIESKYEMRPVLRTLFNADFFKEATFKKVKNPVEIFASTLRLTGNMNQPDPDWISLATEPDQMGQEILNPPSVEGWHTGKEWINSGAFINRVNFIADRMRDTGLPGIQDIINRIAYSNGETMAPETLVDKCLDVLGQVHISEETRAELVEEASSEGPLAWTNNEDSMASSRRVGDVLASIVGTREYQFG
ncbi:MAG: DUF1800 domain-containing protein [SAR202 cluster bacterium]|nr:DUF1800 domain-containing protein [SAR202 cluster bacterium]